MFLRCDIIENVTYMVMVTFTTTGA